MEIRTGAVRQTDAGDVMQNERNGIDIEPLLQREAVRTPFWRNYVLLFVLIIVAVTFLTLFRWEKYKRLVRDDGAWARDHYKELG
jgi:hypothetical protein